MDSSYFLYFFTQNRNFIDFFIGFFADVFKLQMVFFPIPLANFELATSSSQTLVAN